MVLMHGGLAYPVGKKQAHGADPLEGHTARDDRAQSSVGSRLSLQIAWAWIAWEAGLGLSRPFYRRVCPWLLLARPPLSKREAAWKQPNFLEGKISPEQDQRRPQCKKVAKGRLVCFDRLGMFFGNNQNQRSHPASTAVGIKAQEGGVLIIRKRSRLKES